MGKLEAAIDGLDEAVLKLAGRRMEVEQELVAAVLSEPKLGAKMALDSGVINIGFFEQEDLGWIYLAAVLRGKEGKTKVLHGARTLLKAKGFWDEKCVAVERHGHWSVQNLCHFACSYPSPTAVPALARELVEIDYRQKEARRCWVRMVKLLKGGWDEVVVRVK